MGAEHFQQHYRRLIFTEIYERSGKMNWISSLSSNALLTKSRAMNSYTLTNDDYTQLANCRSLSDVLNYLKSNTVYEKAVSPLIGTHVYRARLEAEIRRFNYSKIADLAAFESAIGQTLHKIIYLKNDVRLILSCADHLDTNEISDFSLLTPPSYFRHSVLNPEALERATSFEEFYEALSDTPYVKALDIFAGGTQEFSVSSLENALFRYMYEEIRTLVKKNYLGSAQKDILELMQADADYHLLESIYRMKRFFPNEPLTLTNISYSGFSAFSLAEIEAMLAAKDTAQLFSLFKKSVYGKYFDENASDSIELCTRLAQLKMNYRKLRFSTEPEVTMFSYIGILENETKNLIHIIEGVRYGLEPQKILSFIVTQ